VSDAPERVVARGRLGPAPSSARPAPIPFPPPRRGRMRQAVALLAGLLGSCLGYPVLTWLFHALKGTF
jgi:hypothetical protein